MKVYIAGPIQGWENRQEYRQSISEVLTKFSNLANLNIQILDPWKREMVMYSGQTSDNSFIQRDLRDIDRADVVIAYEPQKSPGTCMELFYAKRFAKKLVIVITSQEREKLSPWIVYHADMIVRKIEDIPKALQKLRECMNLNSKDKTVNDDDQSRCGALR